jgi:hypothetical protein
MEGWEWCLALAWVVCSFWLVSCPRLYLDVVLSVTSVAQYGGGDQREPKFSSCSISPLSALLLELISSTADIFVCILIFDFLSRSVGSSSSNINRRRLGGVLVVAGVGALVVGWMEIELFVFLFFEIFTSLVGTAAAAAGAAAAAATSTQGQ